MAMGSFGAAMKSSRKPSGEPIVHDSPLRKLTSEDEFVPRRRLLTEDWVLLDLDGELEGVVEGKMPCINRRFPTADSSDLARVITLRDCACFQKIRLREFMGGAWQKEDARERAPNLCAWNDHVNQFLLWVEQEILAAASLVERTQCIVFFINVMEHLRTMPTTPRPTASTASSATPRAACGSHGWGFRRITCS